MIRFKGPESAGRLSVWAGSLAHRLVDRGHKPDGSRISRCSFALMASLEPVSDLLGSLGDLVGDEQARKQTVGHGLLVRNPEALHGQSVTSSDAVSPDTQPQASDHAMFTAAPSHRDRRLLPLLCTSQCTCADSPHFQIRFSGLNGRLVDKVLALVVLLPPSVEPPVGPCIPCPSSTPCPSWLIFRFQKPVGLCPGV
jgi:hypothetical protein